MSAMLLVLALLQPAASPVSPAERAAIFKAAGFAPTNGKWLMCDKQTPLELEVRDINGDGRQDAVVMDGGSECYGHTEQGFVLLTKAANGPWTNLYRSPGIPTFLETAYKGWPEIEVGGPGFCFPVVRFDGKTFQNVRTSCEGKPCRRE